MPSLGFKKVLERILEDERYLRNLDWGKPRLGHPEGSLRAHIAELESNLQQLASLVSEEEYVKLQILIHVHDTFKPEAKSGAPITHARSHASLARAFLASFCDDQDLLDIVQYHDEPYALWRHYNDTFQINERRLQNLLRTIKNWDLFLFFLIIDGCTGGKEQTPLIWFFEQIGGKVESRVNKDDIF
ncbi:MAG: hypothetical protein JWQ71_2414 [Pedosphaera sp.]|nr:hypothetical protein [Pedosphaera sp.]